MNKWGIHYTEQLLAEKRQTYVIEGSIHGDSTQYSLQWIMQKGCRICFEYGHSYQITMLSEPNWAVQYTYLERVQRSCLCTAIVSTITIWWHCAHSVAFMFPKSRFVNWDAKFLFQLVSSCQALYFAMRNAQIPEKLSANTLLLRTSPNAHLNVDYSYMFNAET